MSKITEPAHPTVERRFEMAKSAFVLYDSYKLGRIESVNMEGLSFSHIEADALPTELNELDIFLTDYSFCLQAVPIESDSVVKTYEPSFDSVYLGHYSVRFGILTMYQRTQLQCFIQHHTKRELH